MTTKTAPLLLASALLLSLGAACAGEGTTMEPIEMSDREDSLGNRTLQPDILEEIELDAPTTYEGSVTVADVNDQAMLVQGTLLTLHAGVNSRVSFEVSEPGLDLFTNERFVLMYRDVNTEDPWEVVAINGQTNGLFGSSSVTIKAFRSVTIDPLYQTFEFESTQGDMQLSMRSLKDKDVAYALFVFPESGLGDLEDYYEYTLEADITRRD